ncbi:MAG: helix-turn-helix transcriptional regulator [Deltaproteobacteria bacterium]|jgi:transcriptional regulator with XRE-family HTH domain
MKTTKELLGARIKELRKARELSQNELSQRVNVDPKHLSRIEVGSSFPSLATLEKIAQGLSVEMGDLFEFVHLKGAKEVREKINGLLKEADEDTLRTVLKVIRAITR